MNSIYALLLSNVVLAAALAVLVFVFTRLWRNPQIAHALWLMVLVKLVTPPLIHLPMPYFGVASSQDSVGAEASDVLRRSSEKPADPATSSETTLVVWGSLPAHFPEWLLCLSGVGTLFFASVAFARHRRLLQVFAAAETPAATLMDDATKVARQIGLARCPPLRVTDALVCPLVSIGYRQQIVLFPLRLLAEFSRDQTRTVLAHELAHIRRGDHWVRCFELLVLALFWWNPVAWWASRKLRQAEEECCDAWVVWALPDCRRSYGQALLQAVEFVTEGRSVIPIAGAEFGKCLFKRRIEMIMKRKTHHRMRWLVRASILLVGVTVLPLAAVVSNEPAREASTNNLDLVEQNNPVERAAVATAAETYDRSLIEADRDHLEAQIAARTDSLTTIAAPQQDSRDSGDLGSVHQLDERHAAIGNELEADQNDVVPMEHQLDRDAGVAVPGHGVALATLPNSKDTRIDGGDTPESHIDVLELGGVSGTAETMKLGWTFRSEFSFTWSMQIATPR